MTEEDAEKTLEKLMGARRRATQAYRARQRANGKTGRAFSISPQAAETLAAVASALSVPECQVIEMALAAGLPK